MSESTENVFHSTESIVEVEKSIIKDKKQINSLITLTDFLEESFKDISKQKLVFQTLQSLTNIYIHFFKKEKSMKLNVQENQNTEELEVIIDLQNDTSQTKKEFKKWLFGQYKTFIKLLCLYIVHYFTKIDSFTKIDILIEMVLNLMKCEIESFKSSKYLESEKEREKVNLIVFEGPFGKLIYNFIITITNLNKNIKVLLEIFKEEYLNKYNDLRYFNYICLYYLMKRFKLKKKKLITFEQLYENILNLFENINNIEDIDTFYCFESINMKNNEDDGEEGEGEGISENFMFEALEKAFRNHIDGKEQDNDTTMKDDKDDIMQDDVEKVGLLDPHVHLEAFKNFILTLLQLPEMNRKTYERILSKMGDDILPQFEDPFLLNDFIIQSFDQGGLIALLSVKSLFVLITEYNLVYDQFYQKLYVVIEPSLFTMEGREEFFELLDTFLKSSHLPEYIVAAFIKKLIRVSLEVPSYAIVYILSLVYNLMFRHPQLSFLVQYEEISPKILSRRQKQILKEQKPELYEEKKELIDVFDVNETDPKLSRAMESQLWEIETLIHHSNSNVSKLAKDLKKHFANGYPQYNIKNLVTLTSESMFEQLADKKQFTKVTKSNAPTSLFETKQSSDSVFGIFEF
ncbi:hypothetical protein ABK040_010082 [Willaertia magna]